MATLVICAYPSSLRFLLLMILTLKYLKDMISLFHPRDYCKLCVILIHLTIYRSLEEHMSSGVCSIKLQYIHQIHKY